MAEARIRAVITAEDRASATLKGFGNKIDSVAQKGAAAINRWSKRLALAGAAAAGFAIKAAADFEQSRVSFETMLGSADKARVMLKDLSEFAAKTPFELPEVEAAAKQLLAMGASAKDVIPEIEMLGNVSAGLNVPMERLILNFGQVRSQGKLTGRELRDFAIAGVPLLDTLAKQFDKTKEEVTDMVSEGKVGFDDVKKAFQSMSGEGGRFFKLMDKQSKTFSGIMSNIKDNMIRLARDIVGIGDTGDIREGSIFASLKGAAEGFLNWLDSNREKIVVQVEKIVDRFKNFVKEIHQVFKEGGFKAVGEDLLRRLVQGFVETLPKAIEIMVGLIIEIAPHIIRAFITGVINAARKNPMDFFIFFAAIGFVPGIAGTLGTVLAGIPIVGPIFRWILLALTKVSAMLMAPIRGLFIALGARAAAWFKVGVGAIGGVGSWIMGWVAGGLGKVAGSMVAKFSALGAAAGAAYLAAVVAALVIAWKLINDAIKGANAARDAASASAAAAEASERRLIDTWRRAGLSEAEINRRWHVLQSRRGVGAQGRHAGGPVSENRPYIVGEKGPELFVPKQAGNILPNNRMGGGQTINFNVNIGMFAGTPMERREVAKRLFKDFQDVARSMGTSPSKLLEGTNARIQ